MAEENVIELKGVEKTFRDFWMRPVAEAVRGLDLEVARGDVFGLIGPNGSGKSTTIKMILGLIRPTKGSVRLFGLDPRAKAARARLGYLPELSHLHPFLTAEETVLYYAGLSGMKRQEARRRMLELLEELKEKTPCPSSCVYEPSITNFEKLPVKKTLENTFYGELPIEIGYCNGHNTKLNAVEYHRC